MKIINPSTCEVIAELQEDSVRSIQTKFEMVRDAQQAWQNFPLAERKNVIERFSSLLHQKSEELAGILTREMGKPLSQARNEIAGARKRIKWMTENVEKYLAAEDMYVEDALKEQIRYEPLGIVCNISAWNYPYLVGVNVFVPALLAGNTVMYKPSEYASMTGVAINELLKRSGVPEDVFQLCLGGGEVGELLLDTSCDGYFFTGSYRTGQYIYERLARRMVLCQCELGGKDPLYVADDIQDIAAVAAATADGAFYNNGQSCCAVERIYVHEKIYDAYISEFVKEVASYKIGDPMIDGTYIGPLTRKDQLEVLDNQIEEAKKLGARVAFGGARLSRPGFYFEPTVLVDVNHRMAVMKDESFGPIIGIMKVQSDDEAIRLMNDTEYGLTAAVYSSEEKRANEILQRINAGTAYWNCCDRVSAALPWSGRKHSGFGTTLSHAGLRAFTRPKAYHLKN